MQFKYPNTMICHLTFVISTILFAAAGICQKSNSTLPSLRAVRYEENYDSLRIKNQSLNFIEQLKHIEIDKNRGAYISLGAEVRQGYEFYNNPFFGLQKRGTDGFWLQRYHLHTDIHLNRLLRTFLQLGSGIKVGGFDNPAPIQEDKLFMHQAFVEISPEGKSKVKLVARVGRQEMQIGSGRFVSTRIGPNIRQSFDALRIIVSNVHNWSFNAFYSRPVDNQIGYFDNETFSDDSPDFWNVAATHKLPKINAAIDVYYFGFKNRNAEFVQGKGKELRHSLGIRLFTKQKYIDYDAEVMYQFGDFNEGSIRAYTASINAGYTFSDVKWRPRIGLKMEIITGDKNPAKPRLQSFNAFFPEGGYFGGVNILGPSNLYDFHPSLDLDLNKVKLKSALAFVWRYSLADGIYNPGGLIIVKDAGYNNHRFVGTQVQQTVAWSLNRYVSLRGIYGHFFAGSYLRNSKPERLDTDFFTALLSFIF